MKSSVLSLFLTPFLFTSLAQAANAGCAIAGAANAPITIEEFADFECPFCVRGSNTMKTILKDYGGKVKFVYRNMPLPMHPHSQIAAKAFSAICLQSPSLAYSFHNELFSRQDQLEDKGEGFIFDTAQKLGVNVDQMKSDMNSPEVAKILADDEQAARAHGFQGTPSFVVGTETITGAQPYAEFKKIIDKQLGR
jgi:protein-disulfide isomerase